VLSKASLHSFTRLPAKLESYYRCSSYLVSGQIPSVKCVVGDGTSGTSDAAVKQILLIMNEQLSFIIEDLDDHHVVIKADEEYRVRRQLEAEVRHHSTPVLPFILTRSISWRKIPIIRSLELITVVYMSPIKRFEDTTMISLCVNSPVRYSILLRHFALWFFRGSNSLLYFATQAVIEVLGINWIESLQGLLVYRRAVVPL